jgi:hypothetical protein
MATHQRPTGSSSGSEQHDTMNEKADMEATERINTTDYLSGAKEKDGLRVYGE